MTENTLNAPWILGAVFVEERLGPPSDDPLGWTAARYNAKRLPMVVECKDCGSTMTLNGSYLHASGGDLVAYCEEHARQGGAFPEPPETSEEPVPSNDGYSDKMNDPDAPHVCPRGETWIEYDGRGIPLVRVCAACRDEKLARYRPEILAPYTQADVDERIEEEEY